MAPPRPATCPAGRAGDGFTEFVPGDLTRDLHRLTGWAIDHGVALDGLQILRPSLEDVYLAAHRPAAPRHRPARSHRARAPGGGRERGKVITMSSPALAISQVRYVNKAFWRNPASAFFTFAFPLMFLVIFTALLGHGTVHLAGRDRAAVHLLRRARWRPSR